MRKLVSWVELKPSPVASRTKINDGYNTCGGPGLNMLMIQDLRKGVGLVCCPSFDRPDGTSYVAGYNLLYS